MRSLIDITDLSVEELDELMQMAAEIRKNPAGYAYRCHGKRLATLFYEPSTRTRLSFEAAMMDLGGTVLGFSEPGAASVSKGESIADTVRIVSLYADIITIRTPVAGSALLASMYADVPIINAGDGTHCHPTQTLADLLTIRTETGRLKNLTIGFCGDLKNGRTVHSLLVALARYQNIKVVLISPKELELPEHEKKKSLLRGGMEWEETADLESALPKLDVLYMTRVQRERFTDRSVYERVKSSYVLTTELLKKAKPKLAILHPLPRVGEIDPAVDEDPRACYFRQAQNGMFMRMALILKLLEETRLRPKRQSDPRLTDTLRDRFHCQNPGCVMASEPFVKPLFFTDGDEEGVVRCGYCEQKAVPNC